MITNVINLECSTTTKGKLLLLFGGYTYTLNKDRGKVKYRRSCTAFVHTDGKDNYKAHYGSHDGYLPSPEQIQETRQRTCTHVLAFRQKSVDKIISANYLSTKYLFDKKIVDQKLSTKICRPKFVDKNLSTNDMIIAINIYRIHQSDLKNLSIHMYNLKFLFLKTGVSRIGGGGIFIKLRLVSVSFFFMK